MAVDVLTEICIRRPLAEVAAFATDPSNAPEWYDNIQVAEWQTSPPLVVGSRVSFVAHFLGKRLAYTYEVVVWAPQKKLVMSTREGPFPMETTYIWEALSEKETKMTLRNRGTPSGFSKLMAPLMVGAMRRANRKDLKKLKAILESSSSGTATLQP